MEHFTLQLPLDLREASRLRDLLTQTASPGSWQQQMIVRLDELLQKAVRLGA